MLVDATGICDALPSLILILLRMGDLRGLAAGDSFATGDSIDGLKVALVTGTAFVSTRGALDVGLFEKVAIGFGGSAGIANPNGLLDGARGAAGQEKDGLAFGISAVELGGIAALKAAGTKEGAVTDRCCFAGRSESLGELCKRGGEGNFGVLGTGSAA